ncbi:Putative conjugal transfer protein [Pseudidiomarina piscicola]|uniref:Conjugal transfer protein n=1 Tax=Pseudidiomarina piscicola TaxID=2614830 RepID=A0A6S6WPD5_9GAMM|nr:CpaF family protein [Pseudidiomarina piscicola]CAB0152023.1 Putative conjugal transfer protein [Pseudidiomarina piscicola]VZT41465.1 Putative conjugal transfer protein [Pseudomonas aeruginosa]
MINKAALTQFLKAQIQRATLQEDLGSLNKLRTYAEQLLQAHVRQQQGGQATAAQLQLINEVVDDCMGFGPISPLLGDDRISEIMVNHFNSVFIEREGQLEPTSIRFKSEEELLQVIERIVLPLGRRIDSAQPMVDARLPDGSRVNAVIAPLALRGACLTIRKFARKALTFTDLLEHKAISSAAASYLKQMVQARKNVLIVGGTGTGKTTLLNLLASEVPENQRIITIEGAAELKLQHANLIALEARPANAEGRGLVSIRELLINALRMRPDRIVVGECRGAEALDMLQAMNTGHEGSLTTLHANSPREALQRLEVMVMLAGFDMPMHAIRQQIASAIQVIVQISRCSDGRRVITAISEVLGLESLTYQLSPLFEWQNQALEKTGVCSEWGDLHGD